MNPKKRSPLLVCPACGARILLQVLGTDRLEPKPPKEAMDKVKQLFTKTQLANLEIWIHDDGTRAKIVMKKFNKRMFGVVNSEILGYGGHYEKGHWTLPLGALQFASEGV